MNRVTAFILESITIHEGNVNLGNIKPGNEYIISDNGTDFIIALTNTGSYTMFIKQIDIWLEEYSDDTQY